MYLKFSISKQIHIPTYNGEPFMVDVDYKDTVEFMKIKISLVHPEIDPRVILNKNEYFVKSLEKQHSV